MPRRPLTNVQRNVGSKKRADLARIAAKTQSREAIEASITANELARAKSRGEYRVQTAATISNNARRQNLINRTQDTAISILTPSSDSGLIMTTVFVIAGLIVTYILVTNPATTGWLGFLGTSLHALSSNKPLFTTTSTKGT